MSADDIFDDDLLDEDIGDTVDPVELAFRPWGVELKAFCMLMHTAILAGYIIPFAGFALPVIMWATTKDKSKMVDEHGKHLLNWIISVVIYAIALSILGAPGRLSYEMIGLLTIVVVIFMAIAMGKANNGEVYKYPLAIPFIK